MKETVSVLGTKLRYMSYEEAEPLIEEYLDNDTLHTMCVVTKEMLVYAEENPGYRDILEAMDLHVVIDRDILAAAGIAGADSSEKIDDQTLWNGFWGIAARKRKSCFLLAQTEEQTEEMRGVLTGKYPDLAVAGAYAAERAKGDAELIVNEINGVLPDIVLSVLPQPFQEEFLWEQKCKMGAKVWLGLLPMAGRNKSGEERWLSRLIGRTVFQRRVQLYNHMQEQNREDMD